LTPRRPLRAPTSRRRAGLLLLGLALGCAHSPSPTVGKPTPSPPLAAVQAATAELQRRYAGSYLYAGGDAERRAVAAAVERAIAGLSFLAKPIARQSLRQRAEIRDSYTLLFDGLGNLQVSSTGFPTEFGPLDGRAYRVETKYGDQTQVSQHFQDGVLVQEGRTEDGSGRTEFRLADADATLLVHRVMESSQLSAAVDFTLTYRRQ
jgi:hypothetical protein